MPVKKVVRRKRFYRKKRNFYKKRAPISNFPFPMSCIRKLRYHQVESLDPAVGTVKDVVFTASGLYDPYVAIGGHQPYGFDQLMNLYDHYTVVGAICKVNIVNNNVIPFWAGIELNDSSTSLSGASIEEQLERPMGKYKLLNYNSAGGSKAFISKTYSAKKFFKTSSMVNHSLYRGDATTNPTEQAYFHVVIFPNATGDDLISNVVHITIDYIAVFNEPKKLAQS